MANRVNDTSKNHNFLIFFLDISIFIMETNFIIMHMYYNNLEEILPLHIKTSISNKIIDDCPRK